MELTITSADHAPAELYEQLPLVIELLRKIPGEDRPDYWLGRLLEPVSWNDNNIEREITHVVVATRWEGTRIAPHVVNLPVGIACITNPDQLDEARLDFNNCKYVAIGIAHETGQGSEPAFSTDSLSGNVDRTLGTARKA